MFSCVGYFSAASAADCCPPLLAARFKVMVDIFFGGYTSQRFILMDEPAAVSASPYTTSMTSEKSKALLSAAATVAIRSVLYVLTAWCP